MIFKPYTDLPAGLYRGTYSGQSRSGPMLFHHFDLVGAGTVTVPDMHTEGCVTPGQLERCELALQFKPVRTVQLTRLQKTVRVRTVIASAVNHKLLA